MAVKKFAISVPEDVMTQVDRAAAARGARERLREIWDGVRLVIEPAAG